MDHFAVLDIVLAAVARLSKERSQNLGHLLYFNYSSAPKVRPLLYT
jgi:hypothetical protein